MAHEQQVWVCWSFPHFVRYVRAIIIKLTPQPHRCTEAVLDAAEEVLATGKPGLLTKLLTTPPSSGGGQHTPGYVSRYAANAIIEIIGCWAGWDPDPGLTARVKFRDANDGAASRAYDRAKATAHRVELAAIDAGLSMDDLVKCAVDAYGKDLDADRRDAALAAMSAGHFQLSHEIVVNED
jgi:hypothetical protein